MRHKAVPLALLLGLLLAVAAAADGGQQQQQQQPSQATAPNQQQQQPVEQPTQQQQPQADQQQQPGTSVPPAPQQQQQPGQAGADPGTYTCGSGKPVPKPPSFEQLPPPPATTASGKPTLRGEPDEVAAIVARAARAPAIETFPTLEQGSAAAAAAAARAGGGEAAAAMAAGAGRQSRKVQLGQPGPGALGFCSAGVRNAVTLPGPPQAQGAVKLFITKRIEPLPAGCNYTLPRQLRHCSRPRGCTSECSGNTLSDGLILAAAHCVDPLYARLRLRRSLRDTAGYPNDINDDPCNINTHPVHLLSVVACYDFQQTEPDSGGVEACAPNRRYVADGVSWHARPPLTAAVPPTVSGAHELIIPAPHDQSVIFMAAPITHLPGNAFYRYTYKDYYAPETEVRVESYSYIGSCGTQVLSGESCPPVACELSKAGPATFQQPTTLGQTPGAEGINMPVTSFAGASGSCVNHATDGCCFATCSWGITTCERNCLGNFYSPLMSTKPLSELWARRMVLLPAPAGDDEEEATGDA